MLTSPIQDGTTIVVVASRGGDDAHPAWFLNLQSDPRVEVSRQGMPNTPMRRGPPLPKSAPSLWPLVIADHKNYADYQTKTTREIPLGPPRAGELRPSRGQAVSAPR